MFTIFKVIGVATSALLMGFMIGSVASCTPDQVQPSQKPSDGLGVAVQPSVYVDPACFVEGALVAAECNAAGLYPSCPAEDSPRHAGEPCFWINPNGKGLLWSDGTPSPDER